MHEQATLGRFTDEPILVHRKHRPAAADMNAARTQPDKTSIENCH
jgi:hypothetical protein